MGLVTACAVRIALKLTNIGKSFVSMLPVGSYASQHVFSNAARRAASNDYPFVFVYSGLRGF